MTEWYIMATRRKDGEFVLSDESHTEKDFRREYERLANRIGVDNIRIFKEVAARPTVSYVFTDDESFIQKKEDD